MPLLDNTAATHAGTITLALQVSLGADGNATPLRGEITAELLDAAGAVVSEKRAPITRLTAAQQNGLASLLTAIRNTINTELAG